MGSTTVVLGSRFDRHLVTRALLATFSLSGMRQLGLLTKSPISLDLALSLLLSGCNEENCVTFGIADFILRQYPVRKLGF